MSTYAQGAAESRAATLLNRILREFAAESGTVHFLGEDGMLHLAASHGIPPVVLEKVQRIPVGKGMAGLAVERRQPVNTCNLQTDTSGDVRPGARATGLQGAVAVPIFDGGDVVGALGIGVSQERVFSETELQRLMDLGRELAGCRRSDEGKISA